MNVVLVGSEVKSSAARHPQLERSLSGLFNGHLSIKYTFILIPRARSPGQNRIAACSLEEEEREKSSNCIILRQTRSSGIKPSDHLFYLFISFYSIILWYSMAQFSTAGGRVYLNKASPWPHACAGNKRWVAAGTFTPPALLARAVQ